MKLFIKKALTIILAISMLASMMVFANVASAEAAELDIWDGTLVAPTDKGTGEFDINTPEELAYIIKNGGALGNTYNLTTDIYLNDITKIDWATGEAEEGYTPNQWFTYCWWEMTFKGNLNGNGHTVYGLYFIDPTPDAASSAEWGNGAGLIPWKNKGDVTNLGVDYAYVYNNDRHATGALIGSGYNYMQGTIENCYVGENVTVKGRDVAGLVGGGPLAGEVIIKNCYSLATLDGSGCVGGIISDSWEGDKVKVENCYTLNKATGSTNQPAAFTNTYETVASYATLTTEDALKGEVAATTLEGFDFENVWKTTDSYPILRSFAPIELDIWDGTLVAPTDKGTGEFDINTPEELAYIIKNGGGLGNTYNLTTDIYLNDITKIDWATGEAEEGYTPNQWFTYCWWETTFKGNLNGNGHTVYGLYFIDPTPDAASSAEWGNGAGLIPWKNKGDVTNLGVDYAYVYNNDRHATGALIGSGYNYMQGTIENCYVGENVTVKGRDVAGLVGGGPLAGEVIIKNCYSLATLDGSDCVGGIISDSWEGDKVKVENCYTLNKATGSTYMPASFTNTYETVASYATLTTEDALKGEAATATLEGFDFEKVWKLTDSYPTLLVFDGIFDDGTGEEEEEEEIFEGVYWSGEFIAPNANADGIYEITTAEELAYVIKNHGGADNTYVLMNDIYLNDPTKIDWATGEVDEGYTANGWFYGVQADAFYGTLDGNGHVVYGLYYMSSEDELYEGRTTGVALIPWMADANVKNLGVDKSFIQHYAYYAVGAIVGQAMNTGNGNIDNCYAGADVTLKGYDVAGIIGGGDLDAGDYITLNNCYSLARLIATHKSGGLIADTWSWDEWKANNCYTIGKATGSNWQPPTFTNVYETGASIGTLVDKDALIGETAKTTLAGFDFINIWKVTDSYPTLLVFDGIVIEDTIYWDGTTVAPKANEDGVYEIYTAEELAFVITTHGGVGNTYKLMNDIYLNNPDKIDWATGAVEEDYAVKEWFYGVQKDAFNGTLDGNGHVVYGLYYQSDASEFYDGRLTGVALIPWMGNGEVKNIGVDYAFIEHYACYAVGAIVGQGQDTIVATISNCYAGANVTLKGYDVAGIIGGGYSPDSAPILIENCYSLATLQGTHSNGGILGTSWQDSIWQIKNCYCLGKALGIDWHAGTFTNVYETAQSLGTLVTADQLKGEAAAATLSGLDFDTVWDTTEDYPVLRVFGGEEVVEGLGDANGDGDINVVDLVRIKKMAAAEEYSNIADVNKDGTVNSADLTALRKHILGIASIF